MSKLLFSSISRTGSLIVGESGRKNKEKVPWARLGSAQSFQGCLWLRRHVGGHLRVLWASDASRSSLRSAMRCRNIHCLLLRSWPLFRFHQHRITWRSPFSHILLAPLEHNDVCSSLLVYLVYLQSPEASICQTDRFIHHFLIQFRPCLCSS